MIIVYMLECADGSYYVGSTRAETVERRLSEHNSGTLGGYTSARRPVSLVWQQSFASIVDGIGAERQIKGWSRAKKQALIGADWNALSGSPNEKADEASDRRPFESRLAAGPSRPGFAGHLRMRIQESSQRDRKPSPLNPTTTSS